MIQVMNINKEILRNFRSSVNGNYNFVNFTYSAIEDKNKWNIICSSMDWITIGVSYLTKPKEFDDNANIKSMQFYSIISAIDLVVEAIKQIARVIMPKSKLPYDQDSSIFKKQINDDLFFKEIRAMFGAHPVNLRQNNDKERWYASWSYESYDTENAFELLLYSNEKNKDFQRIKISINDLEKYLIQRYEYLKTIEKKIIEQYNEFITNLKNIPIIIKKTPIENILELKKESKRRLNNDYYSGVIESMNKLFSTTLKDNYILIKKEKIYKKDLENLIYEIISKLQKMEFEGDLNYSYLIDIKNTADSHINYCINKLIIYIFDNNDDPLLDLYLKSLDQFSKQKYNFVKSSNKNEIYLKLQLLNYENIK